MPEGKRLLRKTGVPPLAVFALLPGFIGDGILLRRVDSLQFCPHAGQKAPPGGTSAPQRGQALPSLVPQRLQNFEPAGTCSLHAGQSTIPPAAAGPAPLTTTGFPADRIQLSIT